MPGGALQYHHRGAPRRRLKPVGCALLLAVAMTAAACSSGSGPQPSDPTRPVPATTPTTVTVATTVPEALRPLIEGTGMTELGRKIFLDASPLIEDGEDFARNCAQVKAGDPDRAHTHGCFVQGRIHLREVGARQISGLIYVVAAHELLHAVYARLPAAEKSAVDAALEVLRARTAMLRERLRAYGAADDLKAELHSVTGTEFGDLPQVLEDHYDRYFDRAKVLSAYRSALGNRDSEIRRLRAQVADLDERIDVAREHLDDLQSGGDIEGYNAAVDPFNTLVAERNQKAETLNALVGEYNRLITA